MASGVPVDDNVVNSFREMKLRRTAKWMIFKINDDKIVLEHSGSTGAKDFKSKLPSKDCRYGVYDTDAKIQFVMWSPDDSPVRARMVYAASKDALIKKLEGASPVALEAHDMNDLEEIK